MLQQISFTILIVSFLVLIIILLKKGPHLFEIEAPIRKKESFLFIFKNKITAIPFLKNFSWNKVLQKVLSKTRITILKIEGKIGEWLHLLRKISARKKR